MDFEGHRDVLTKSAFEEGLVALAVSRLQLSVPLELPQLVLVQAMLSD